MGVSKEVFVDLQEKFEKVQKLVEEDSKLDPENEPYLSKYAARLLLLSMKGSIEKLQANTIPETKDLLDAMLGTVWLYLGLISVDTEELSTGEIQLNTGLTLVEEQAVKPMFVLVVLNALNQLGILWSLRDEPQKSKQYLTQAEKLYTDFKASEEIPVSLNDLFHASGERNTELANRCLEKTHTLTLYYLAQIYGSLKDALKSAVYCHVTLKRQLELNDYEPIDWALNAATLSQFFMEKTGFKQARHHLAAASYMLSTHEDKLNAEIGGTEEHDAKIEVFKHRSADVARCWAKYGLLLLLTSRDRLLNHTDDEEPSLPCSISSDLAKLQLSPDSTVSIQDLSNLYFPTLKLDIYEKHITDQFILTFEDAREVFRTLKSWLHDAQQYYTLENHASDYVQIIQDMSQMFSYLAFFEEDPDNQSKMHKRRVDNLESVLKEINPKYYVHACQQIWYELGETYNMILEIKMDKLKSSSERPTAYALTKVNSLAEKSIQHYSNFLDSLKIPTTQIMPVKFHDDLEKPALQAYFHIAVLYGKYITPDKNIQIENTKQSLEYFTKIVDYCNKHEKACEHVKIQLGVCREMVSLLPYKIRKFTQEIMAS